MSDDMMEQLEQEANDQTTTDEEVAEVARLTQLQQELESEVEEMEAALKAKKQELRQVSEVDLPNKLDETGLSEIRLKDGRKVKVEEKLHASIPQKNRAAAAEWLREHGLGDIVKEEVSVPLEPGSDELREMITNYLESQGISRYKVAETMHTGTVKSTIKELMEDGVDVPLKLFGAYIQRATSIE